MFLCCFNWVGAKVLEHVLSRSDIDDLAVFTHEPKVATPDLRSLAKKNGIWCATASVNYATWPFEPDIVSSVYYRKILATATLDRVAGKAFNLHPSLLPCHRGCSSLTWAIIEGDPFAGISYHYIDSGIDTGPILLQSVLHIAPGETQETLYGRAMDLGASFWPAAFELIKAGFPGVPQQGEPSYHKRETPFGGRIDDDWSLDKIERFIRAMTFPPYPYATYQGQQVKSLDDYLKLRKAKS
jgi:methionyl-tRNA formyltransferase